MSTKPKKISAAAGAGFLLSLTLLFIGPSYLYFTNLLQIPYFYSDMVWVLAAGSIAAGAAVSLLLFGLRGRLHQRAVALVFALGLLLWIQGNILVWNYGVLDGREIIWSDYLLNGIIDSAIWIAVLAVALLKAPLIYRHIAWASLALILVQGAGLAAEILKAPGEPEWKGFSVGYDDREMFEFSGERNVIILVLDMFQSDIFQEIIAEDRGCREIFDGFTYFRNAVGGFPTTYPSVTFILTGRRYDNSIPIRDFIKQSFLADSIPRALKEAGYQVGLYELPSPKAIYTSDEICSNAGGGAGRSRVERKAEGRKSAGELLRLTLFRYLPHALKSRFYFVPYLEPRSAKKVDQDVVFFNSLAANTVFSGDRKTFKFYHLKGAHPPYTLNAKLQREHLPQDRSGCKEQARAALRIAGELIGKLRESGSFDHSLLFVIGDHGNPWASAGLNLEPLGREIEFDRDNIALGKVVCSGIPLVLAKPLYSAGELKISDAPVSLGDIPRTIAAQLRLTGEFPGRSILEIGEAEEREREFCFYRWDNRWDQNYLPKMEKFTVNGHSWLPGSWKATGVILLPAGGD